MKKVFILTALALLLVAALLTSCGPERQSHIGEMVDNGGSSAEDEKTDGTFTKFDKSDDVPTDATLVTFDGAKATIDGKGAKQNGDVVEITMPGTYVLSGEYDGTVHVKVSKQEKVRLVLNDAQIYSTDTSAIYVESADKTVITLVSGTENIVSDGTTYVDGAGYEPNACIFSADDLSFNGTGKLTVNANCNNGIATKNDLKILSGEFSITACKNAIKGKDSVTVADGKITVIGAKDGIKSDCEEQDKGVVTILGGQINITCSDDGIQAESAVEIKNAKISLDVGDKTVNCNGNVSIADGCITQ